MRGGHGALSRHPEERRGSRRRARVDGSVSASRSDGPLAVGPVGKARDEAEAALRAMELRGARETLLAVAEAYAHDARAAVEEVLHHRPPPSKAPKPPAWLSTTLLPALVDSEGHDISPERVANLLAILAAFPPTLVTDFVPFEETAEDELAIGRDFTCHVARWHPTIFDAREGLTETSRTAFVWALFEAWNAAGSPPKDKWALFALAALGSEATARTLLPEVRAMLRAKKHARATLALDVFALLALHPFPTLPASGAVQALAGLAARPELKEIAAAAAHRLTRLANDRGLSQDELSDLVGMETARRLEQGMVRGRRMPLAHFRRAFVEARAQREVAQGLVWGAYDVEGRIIQTFRVAEDGVALDLACKEVHLEGSLRVGVVHPTTLDEQSRALWANALAEGKVVAPFPQLGRPTFTVDEAERESTAIVRFAGREAPTGAFLGLARMGWRPITDPDEDRRVVGASRRLGATYVKLELAPGYDIARPNAKAPQTLGLVSVRACKGGLLGDKLPLAAVDPLDFSEVVRELASLFER